MYPIGFSEDIDNTKSNAPITIPKKRQQGINHPCAIAKLRTRQRRPEGNDSVVATSAIAIREEL